ncbi:hypothetical protein ACFO4N_05725 [Camelliibacillus cellulosilyticus]|uniref:ABC transporter ATPase n=1 Tax=Camelliibacillus cellulosilyticus TaxID=2174486 RepID=A0ABV9GMU7_9BACL
MLNKLSEGDFAVLRGPFESGRQSPQSLGGNLILVAFLQWLVFLLIYILVSSESVFPYKETIYNIHLVITILLTILSIIYAIPKIYIKSQRMQYFIVILVSQNLGGILFFIGSLFTLGSKIKEASINMLILLTYVLLAIGLLIFVLTSIRFFMLLKKGEYRKGSKKDFWRLKLEKKSLTPLAIGIGIFLVSIVNFFIRTDVINHIDDIRDIVFVFIGVLLFYTMLFVLPEQLVILYCKWRFESFNFDENDQLKPMRSGDRLNKNKVTKDIGNNGS